MAVDTLITATTAISAYSSQAQTADAQKNRQTLQPATATGSEPRFSVSGQVRSGLEQLRENADALGSFTGTPAFSGLRDAAQALVDSVNNLRRNVADTAGKAAAGQEARNDAQRADGTRASQVQAELRKAEQSASQALKDLRDFGVERLESGSLALNPARLQNRFDEDPGGTVAAFTEVANRVGQALDQQVSAIGTVRSSQNAAPAPEPDSASLSDASRGQARLEAQKNEQQRLASQLAGAGSYAARTAVVTYLRISDF